ncbi:MAG: hypothetical protein Kow0089_09510 [Desulfobulbaceae bacterium]
MKKEWLLFLASGTLTIGVALLLIRWLAPGLLGVPVDLQMVQVEKKVPPFFDNVFRQEDWESDRFILQDPVSKIRAHPLIVDTGDMGPHDILGFRSRETPYTADVITIGDSQTYGVNVQMDFNWPSTLRKRLEATREISVYNMSVGGWTAIQYFYIFKYALRLAPRIVVVAFYSGNDPLESFTLAYGSDVWKEFRLDPGLDKSDAPKVEFPPPESDQWRVTFSDDITTTFAPKLRLTSNLDHPAPETGWKILALVAKKISELAATSNVQVVYTIIPTKELVYADKIAAEGIAAPEEYTQLVTREQRNIDWLREQILALSGAHFVDVLQPLQMLAKMPAKIYPQNINGHPVHDGYYAIGAIISKHLEQILPPAIKGLAKGKSAQMNEPEFFLVREKRYWRFASRDIAEANGWDTTAAIPSLTGRDVALFEYMGMISTVDKKQFGP